MQVMCIHQICSDPDKIHTGMTHQWEVGVRGWGTSPTRSDEPVACLTESLTSESNLKKHRNSQNQNDACVSNFVAALVFMVLV